MKKILLALSFVCCALWIGAGVAPADSVKVPVNKITDDGVGEAIGFITFADDGKGGVDVLVDIVGISEGEHGMHVQQPERLTGGVNPHGGGLRHARHCAHRSAVAASRSSDRTGTMAG